MIVTGPSLHNAWIMAAGFSFFKVACAWAYILEESSRAPGTRGEYLLEDPDDRNVCLVAVTIVRNRLTVGRDRGAAWFEGGALHFSGERTSFIVGGENVLPQSRWSVFNDGEGMALPAFALPLDVDDVPTYVSFRPLSHSDRSASYGQEILFMRRLAPLRKPPGTRPRSPAVAAVRALRVIEDLRHPTPSPPQGEGHDPVLSGAA